MYPKDMHVLMRLQNLFFNNRNNESKLEVESQENKKAKYKVVFDKKGNPKILPI